MRVKTEDRRQAIIDAATVVFRDVGYERASMAMISARVGGSKTTLYSYFKSKEELFAAAMFGAVEEQGQELIGLLDTTDPDVARVLTRFGEAYLPFISSEGIHAILRAAVADGARIGPLLYEAGPKRAWGQVEAHLSRFIDAGALRPADPRFMAAHLKGLLEAGFMEPRLFGAKPIFPVKPAAKAAVDAFLRAYKAE